jgi:RNA polymerase sigma-70 factor (ECF subfamily)
VLAALSELPRPYREAVAAVDVAGLSYAEAARALGVRQGTIMSRVYRGREQVALAVGSG